MPDYDKVEKALSDAMQITARIFKAMVEEREVSEIAPSILQQAITIAHRSLVIARDIAMINGDTKTE